MRTLAELRVAADKYGVEYDDTFGTRELMDALRDRLGVADPDLNLDPMKCQDLKSEIDWSSDRPFARLTKYFTPKYVVEPKLDGARARIVFGTTENSVPTGRRSGVTFGYIDRKDNFPQVRDLVVPELAGTVIDCEVMMPAGVTIPLDDGTSTKGPLNTVMAVLNIAPAKGVARQRKYGWAEFFAFDLIALAGHDMTHEPLSVRRMALERVLAMLEKEWRWVPTGEEPMSEQFPFSLLPQFDVTEDRLQWLLDQGYEGGIIKHIETRYVPGGRNDSWLKVKKMSTGDFFIVGSKPGKGRNEGLVGSLCLAYHAPGQRSQLPDKTWIEDAVYVADCRGFDDKTCDMLTDPATGGVKAEHMYRVLEVMGQGRTKNDRIRHPHFQRWRDDKSREDCLIDQLHLFSEV